MVTSFSRFGSAGLPLLFDFSHVTVLSPSHVFTCREEGPTAFPLSSLPLPMPSLSTCLPVPLSLASVQSLSLKLPVFFGTALAHSYQVGVTTAEALEAITPSTAHAATRQDNMNLLLFIPNPSSLTNLANRSTIARAPSPSSGIGLRSPFSPPARAARLGSHSVPTRPETAEPVKPRGPHRR